jgi:hypothetical protein
MKQPIFAICALFLLSAAAYAQTIATTTDGRKVILNSDGAWKYADNAASSVTLKIEAGIVYKTGGPQPVARTTFYLLDGNPMPEIEKRPPSRFAQGIVKNAAEEFRFGATQTRAKYGCAYWLMEIDLTKDQNLILDQNNAAEAR